MGREGVVGAVETLTALVEHLKSEKRTVVLEAAAANFLGDLDVPVVNAVDMQKYADLLIVVGGDGSLLDAARIAINNELPVLGINRGRLGFLTDIHPNQLEEVTAILNGDYKLEQRFLLEANLQRHNESPSSALNDVVLLPGDIAHMIEFDLFVDDQFVCHHRADGMIIATPTGSTAYALSGGGSILHPNLDAVILVPMFPHTLSSRPIVISSNSRIDIKITENNETSPYLSCDGRERIAINPGEQLTITKKPQKLQLIHPSSYNYFDTLRGKLKWEQQATRKSSC